MESSSKEDILKLREAVFSQADKTCSDCMAKAHSEAEKLIAAKEDKLRRELALYSAETDKKAAYAKRELLQQARQENAAKTMHFKDALLEGAFKKLSDKLVGLRQSKDYLQILCGMADEAAELLKTDTIVLSLAKEDLTMKETLTAELQKLLPAVAFTVSDTPALISGGLIAVAGNGRKQVCIDWQTVVEEYSDDFAERLLTSGFANGGR